MNAYRISRQLLETRLKYLCIDLGWKQGERYIKGEDGTLKANVGCVWLQKASRGWTVNRMSNEAGGQSTLTPSWQTLTAAETLYWIEGAETAAKALASRVKTCVQP